MSKQTQLQEQVSASAGASNPLLPRQESRRIFAHASRPAPDPNRPQDPQKVIDTDTQATVPKIALHVNKESREEALRKYRLLSNYASGCDKVKPVYYNPLLDIIELGGPDKSYSGHHLFSVQSMPYLDDSDSLGPNPYPQLPYMNALEWTRDKVPADLDTIQSIQIVGDYSYHWRPNELWYHLQDNNHPNPWNGEIEPRCFLEFFRRLKFFSIINSWEEQ